MSGSAGTFPALVNDIVESLAECQQNLARIGEKINDVQASSKCNYKTTSEGLFTSARLVGRPTKRDKNQPGFIWQVSFSDKIVDNRYGQFLVCKRILKYVVNTT